MQWQSGDIPTPEAKIQTRGETTAKNLMNWFLGLDTERNDFTPARIYMVGTAMNLLFLRTLYRYIGQRCFNGKH